MLFGGIGGVESADASVAVWDLSRQVRTSAVLTRRSMPAWTVCLGRLGDAPSAEVTTFLRCLDGLLREFGHRGPHRWDLRSQSWMTRPELVLGMVESIRFQSDDHAPELVAAAARPARERLTAKIATGLEADPETRNIFLAGVRSGALFFQLREAGKSGVIRFFHETKLALMELGGRMVARGVLDDPQQLFFVLDDELDAFVATRGLR